MKKTKRIIAIFLSVIIALGAIYLPIYTFAQSDQNLLKNAALTANPEYYNGWYEYNRPLSAVTDGQTYVGIGYNAGNMLALPYAIDGTAFVNFKKDSPITINKLKLYLVGSAAAESNAITDYAVDVKLSDESWKRVAEKHTDSYSEWDAKVETLCFEAVETTEVIITLKNSKGQSFAAIYEIEGFFDESITPEDYTSFDSSDVILPMPTPVNVLAGKAATCSSGYNDWYAVNRPILKLTDEKYVGNAGEMWAIDYKDGYAYFEFSFDKLTSINKIITSFPGSAADVVNTDAANNQPAIIRQIKDYAIDGMLEDGSWMRLAERHIDSNNEAIDYYSDTVLFEPQKVVKLRFTFANAYGQEWAAVREVEAYNDSTVTSDKYTEIDCKDFTEYAVIKPDYKNLLLGTEIKANEAYYNGWYPDNRALANLTDGNTFVGVGYNAGNATVIPYEEDSQAYVTFKLKEKTHLNKLVIYFPGTSSYTKEEQVSAYAVEVKIGDKWERVAVRILENSENWDAYYDTAIFNAVETDEIRILFVNSKEQTEVSIFEIEAFADNRLKDTDSDMPELPYPQLPPTEPDGPTPEEPKEPTNILKDSTEIKANNAYYNGWYPDNRALANLIDDNTFVGIGYNAGSATSIPYEEDGQAFVSFKLKEKTILNKLVIYFPGTSAYPKNQQNKCYIVEVKNGGEWKRVAVRNIEGSDNWDAYSDTAEFNRIECEEVKVIFIQTKSQTETAIFEIQAYLDSQLEDTDKPLEELPKNPENLLKNAANIRANDAYYNGWYPIYRTLEKSIDGNKTFKFNASKSTMIPYGSNKHAYIQYDFDEVVKANKLIFYSPDAGEENSMSLKNRLTDYAVDIKLKDGTWKRIIEQHNDRVDDWDIYYEEYLFETVQFVSLRFISKSTDDQAYLAILELELLYDQQSENAKEYMERFVGGESVYKTDKINNSMFGTEKQIEMPIKSLLAGIAPTVGLGDNSWYSVERPLVNITDGIQDVFTPANITTIDYHDSIAYYEFKFESAVKVNTFRFFVPQNSVNDVAQRPVDFAIDVMLSDGTWKRVAEQHIERKQQEDAYCETVTFKTEECLAIRLTSVADEKMTHFGLSEVEAYYNAYITDGYTGVNKAPNSKREVPLPKIRNIPTAKFN